MSTIKIFLPSEEVESFRKFANKTKKNVTGFDFFIGEPKMKLFRHPVINEDGKYSGYRKVFHEVCDLIIEMPECREWKLLATYKDGAFTPTNPTKELVFKNKEHGSNYNKCDYCGHLCKNSYVIENSTTGEELQVGFECVKKFGLQGIDYLSSFVLKLYKIYNYKISYATDRDFGDPIPTWGGKPDAVYKNAFLKADMIMSAKKAYDKEPLWRKGYRENGYYKPSYTAKKIETYLCNHSFDVNNEYVAEVCSYALTQKAESEFAFEMMTVAKNHYVYISQIVYAFFLVKSYEDSLKSISVKRGMQVKITGKVIQKTNVESFYGLTQVNTILTDNGTVCERRGKVSAEKGEHCEFYSIVKEVNHGKVYLDRITKSPKKGVNVIAI